MAGLREREVVADKDQEWKMEINVERWEQVSQNDTFNNERKGD